MKVLRFLSLLVLVNLAGCRSLDSISSHIGTHYTKFEVSNYRGEKIADWVAEGPFYPSGDAFSIKAVERCSGGPYPQYTRYPNGWRTRVNGPHIIYYEVRKPAWLVEWDGKP